MESDMRQLLYVSSTKRDVPGAMLESILSASRKNNAPAGISGMLMYLEGGFLQVLEGEADQVEATYQRIRTDKRHWNAQTLLDRAAPRAFSNWTMGFQRIPSYAEDSDPFSATREAVFSVSREAIAGRLTGPDVAILATLLQTFYRIQTGAG
jgi:hypothetical protein